MIKIYEKDKIYTFVLVFLLSLMVFSYLPILEFNYFTQDQWRAFRYSIFPDSNNFNHCIDTVKYFYLQTGRPLVWIGECIEHSIVSQLDDFILLRPVSMIILIFSSVYISYVISKITNNYIISLCSSIILLTSPGYSFMFLQGGPAFMVLICLLTSFGSFLYMDKFLTSNFKNHKSLFYSFIFFIFSCFNYVSYAFIVLILLVLKFVFATFENKVKHWNYLFFSFSLYFVFSLFYYISVKFFVYFSKASGHFINLGTYSVNLNFDLNILYLKLSNLFLYLFKSSPFNYSLPDGFGFFIYLFSIFVIAFLHKGSIYDKIIKFIIYNVVVFFTFVCSISPWLFSSALWISTRYLLPWYLLISIFCMHSLYLLLNNMVKNKKYIYFILISLLVIPCSFSQNKFTFSEIITTNTEIDYMSYYIKKWFNNKGWENNRLILILPPKTTRLSWIKNYIVNNEYGNDNAVLASSTNFVSIPWMVNAIIRKINTSFDFNIVNCNDDVKCYYSAIKNPRNVIIGYYPYTKSTVNLPDKPYIINMSKLTDDEFNLNINVVNSGSSNSTSSSSHFKYFDAYGLLSDAEPGWHASVPVKYPQYIYIKLSKLEKINYVMLHHQDKFKKRMPKDIDIYFSEDNLNWNDVFSYHNICDMKESYHGWVDLKLKYMVKSKYIKIKINSNCGDSDYLTLRGIYLK